MMDLVLKYQDHGIGNNLSDGNFIQVSGDWFREENLSGKYNQVPGD